MSTHSENKTCQNCKNSFVIEPEDFDFYEKIKVPPPTFCPTCSHQRRFAWRNTHSLYKRKCSATGKDIISIYSPDKNLNVVDQKYWWSDEWDPFDYGFEYDFSLPFFSQWKKLRDTIPIQGLSNSKAVNSEYCNVAEESSDCYLVSAAWKNERTMYSDSITEIKDSLDLYVVHKSEFCFNDCYCKDSYRLFYSEKSSSCTNSYFLYDCRGCTDCFMSSNLRNKSYIYFNQQLLKNEYNKAIANHNLGSHKEILDLQHKFDQLKIDSIHKYANIINCNNVTGDDIDGVSDSKEIFDVSGNVRNSKYIYWAAKNIFDCYYCNAIGQLENSFESCDSGVGGSNYVSCNVVYNSSRIEYSFNCYNCSDCFGCYGLRNKQYCILNKQYTKDEYISLVSKIKKHMDEHPYVDNAERVYKYGEFFPVELSPFCYNETLAQSFFPLTKEQISSNGYSYKEKEAKNYNITINSENLPDNIKDVSDDVLNEIIQCDHRDKSFDKCSEAFKITKDELAFYKRFEIPLPRLCYQCRHNERFLKRNPLKLWHRKCMCNKENHNHPSNSSGQVSGKCEVEFETSYAPGRPEIVYCEKCYQQEVI